MTRRTKYGRRTWGRADDLGVDPEGGPWAVICEDHATILNVPTGALARTTATVEFCDECRDAEPAPEVDDSWATEAAAIQENRAPAAAGTPEDLDTLVAYMGEATAAVEVLAGALRPALDHLQATAQDDQVASFVAWVQDTRRALAELETQATDYAGRNLTVSREGVLSDGRRYVLKRGQNRKAWDHDGWKHDARAAVIKGEGLPAEVVDPETGTFINLYTLLEKVQEVHGSSAPRVGVLRALHLDPDDYSETTPGRWSVIVTDDDLTTLED